MYRDTGPTEDDLAAAAAAQQEAVRREAAQRETAAREAAEREAAYWYGPAEPAGPDLAVLRAVLQATTPVSGSWGHGRLLRTSLLSVLITSNGRLLFGAVTPAVLYADAASLSR